MSKKPKFNDNQAKEMVNRFKQRESIKGIARSMKTTPITVKRYLKKAGVYRKPRKKYALKGKQAVAKPESLEQIITQLKQAEAEIASLKKALAQALVKQERKFKALRKVVNV